jgi:ketosteroid isomerase-like protein
MNAHVNPVDTLADAFFGALEAGSVEDVNACFAPGATIWHNFDCKTLTPQENVPGLEALFGNFVRREYREVRRQPTPAGFVQQHVLRLETPDGTVIDWPACIIFDVSDGRISRLAEYVDLSQLSPGS